MTWERGRRRPTTVADHRTDSAKQGDALDAAASAVPSSTAPQGHCHGRPLPPLGLVRCRDGMVAGWPAPSGASMLGPRANDMYHPRHDRKAMLSHDGPSTHGLLEGNPHDLPRLPRSAPLRVVLFFANEATTEVDRPSCSQTVHARRFRNHDVIPVHLRGPTIRPNQRYQPLTHLQPNTTRLVHNERAGNGPRHRTLPGLPGGPRERFPCRRCRASREARCRGVRSRARIAGSQKDHDGYHDRIGHDRDAVTAWGPHCHALRIPCDLSPCLSVRANRLLTNCACSRSSACPVRRPAQLGRPGEALPCPRPSGKGPQSGCPARAARPPG